MRRGEYRSAQVFLSEQEVGDRLHVEAERERAEHVLVEIDQELIELDERIETTSSFASDLRRQHRIAAQNARRAAAALRDRETYLHRLVPLRAQYAEDVGKLTMLAEARRLFDPLQVQVCPACFSPLAGAIHMNNGACTLCGSDGATSRNGSVSEGAGSADVEEAPFDVSSELRATKARLSEITAYVEELSDELDRLRSEAGRASEEEVILAQALDASTGRAVTPYLGQRDELMRRRQVATRELERANATVRMHASVDWRGADVTRLEEAVTTLRHELDEVTAKPDRRSVVHLVSVRFSDILADWHYPKLEQAFINDRLIPHVRGSSYLQASSGGRTLISLAWMLAVFEVGWEEGSAHPGFLLIDSPQKNLGQGGDRDAEFADRVTVDDFYTHLRRWLSSSGHGAQIIVVDNSPPGLADDDTVVRYSRRADQPPYGLIEDEVF